MAFTPEQEKAYLVELVKVGFDKAQARRIVAESQERMQREDAQLAKLISNKPQQRSASQLRPAQVPLDRNAETRARNVILAKHFKVAKKTATRTRLIRLGKQIDLPERGRNALKVMQEMLAGDLRELAFSDADISYILEG